MNKINKKEVAKQEVELTDEIIDEYDNNSEKTKDLEQKKISEIDESVLNLNPLKEALEKEGEVENRESNDVKEAFGDLKDDNEENDLNSQPLPEEHSKLIMEALSKVNDLSEKINRKDTEFLEAQLKLDRYISEFELQLDEALKIIGLPVIQSREYYEERRVVNELFKVANRLASDLKDYSENQDHLKRELEEVERTLEKEKRSALDSNSNESYEGLLFRISSIIDEIDDLNQNQKYLNEMYSKYMELLKKSQKNLQKKEITMSQVIQDSLPYYEIHDTMMDGLLEHRRQIERLSREKADLKFKYKISIAEIDELSQKIEKDNKSMGK